MSVFKEKVVKAVYTVPYGKVASYGQIALMVGIPRAARMVGQVLRSLEDDILTGKQKFPWWRIVNNAGRISIKGTKYHTPQMQKEKLESEGVDVSEKLTFDIEKYRFRPGPDVLQDLELPEETIEVFLQKYFF